MNNCIVCKIETKNKKYCSMKCRDIYKLNLYWEKGNCKICGNEMIYYKKRKKIYCSNICSGKDLDKINKMIESSRKNNVERYGVNHPMKNDIKKNIILKKMKKTVKLKYGVEHYSKTNEFSEKFRNTMISKYGTEYAQQNEIIKNKTVNTVNNKYGGFTFQSKELKNKAISTLTEKYGVDCPTKNKDIMEKIKNTNLKKYGTVCPLQSENIQQKSKKSMMEKYGVDNISKVKYIIESKNEMIRKKFYYSLFTTDRLQSIVTPLFDVHEYTDSKYEKEYLFLCKKCNSRFFDNLYSGNIPRCIVCYPINKSYSIAETEISTYLSSLKNINIVKNSKSILPTGKELDIYLPDYKIAIEYNGLYWHSEISGKKSNMYHINKTNECNSIGIRLLHIFENEWLNKQDIVKSILKNMLIGSKKIYARNCYVDESINYETKKCFLNENHLQGNDNSSIQLCLRDKNNSIVSMMTFGLSRFDKKYEWEIIRFCNKIDVSVIGGAEKMLSFFIKKYCPKSIVTYSDNRYFSGKIYEKLNFKFVGQTPPNYWYVKDCKIYNRINFQKHKLIYKLETFNNELTEWENMQLNGYDRIWDCGNFKYELII